MLLLIEASYKKLQEEAQYCQERLKILVAYFQKKSGVFGSKSPIQPIYVSGLEKTYALAKKMKEQGLDVRAIVPPTTKKGKECLRVVLHTFNQEEEIDKLIEFLP